MVRYHGVLAPNASLRSDIVPGDETADVLECPKCGGRLRLVAAIIDGLSARRYLEGVGLAEPRPGIAARGPPTERRVA